MTNATEDATEEPTFPAVRLAPTGQLIDPDETAAQAANVILEGDDAEDCESDLTDVIDALTDGYRTSGVRLLGCAGFGEILENKKLATKPELTAEDIEYIRDVAWIINTKGLPFAVELCLHFDDPAEAMKERYRGEFPSLRAWAEEYHEDAGTFQGLPKSSPLEMYFDMDAWVRDCQLGGDITVIEVEGKYTVHVFDA